MLVAIGCREDKSDDASAATPLETKQLLFYHTDTQICLNPNGEPVEKIYCWQDGQQPQVVITNDTGSPFVSIRIWQSGVCGASTAGMDCIGTKDTTAGTWAENVTCSVNGSTYICPTHGPLTFP